MRPAEERFGVQDGRSLTWTSGGTMAKQGFFKKWKARLFDPAERANYFALEGSKIIWVLIWAGITAYISFRYGKEFYDAGANWWIILARTNGQALNLNCAIVLLPVARNFLSWLRTTPLEPYFPFDKNLIFHRYIAWFIAFSGVFHGCAHYYNFGNEPNQYFPGQFDRTDMDAAWVLRASITGNFLYVCMALMYGAAHSTVRRSSSFTIFWFTHHLFIGFYVLLLIHGPRFWKFFIAPGAIYFLERVWRIWRGKKNTTVVEVQHLKSNVYALVLEKQGFTYRSGQYAFLNCPYLSRYEWHPFTISSCPEEPYVSFHIRVAGDWTRSLEHLLNPNKRKQIKLNKWIGPDGTTPLIRFDGPFGAAAEDIFNYDYVMLVSCGIGTTPYASILKHIHYRRQRGEISTMKKVCFYWINRDEGAYEWFAEILNKIEEENKGFIEMNTFMTGRIKTEDIRLIVDMEARSGNVEFKEDNLPEARALYSYLPVRDDEIELEVDDRITILERHDDGWLKGENHRTDEIGMFPGNYAQIIDRTTKLASGVNRNYGRPNWNKIFSGVRKQVEGIYPEGRPKVGVFFCGPGVLSKQLYKLCVAHTKKGRTVFQFKKEVF